MTYLDWHNCYKSSWKGEITPDAFQHPAKYARRLIARIYDHLLTEGLIQRGDSAVDPFGGVALGALDAMRLGLHWTGNELEEKFVKLGRANIDLWNTRYGRLPNWGTARLLHGDSRKLAEVVCGATTAAMKSPPYTGEALGHSGGEGPNAASKNRKDYAEAKARLDTKPFYGDGHPANLGNLREGDFSAAVSSPPYAAIATGAGGLNTKPARNGRSDDNGRNPLSPSQIADQHYGDTAGQLSGMREGNFDAVISSPPYEEARIGETSGAANVGHNGNYGSTNGQLGSMEGGDFHAAISSPPYEDAANTVGCQRNGTIPLQEKPQGDIYGDTDGNIGNDSGETFWLAARTIVEQTYQVLTPKGVAVFVCKDFVRSKKVVPFCDQWRQLCEAVGFQTLYIARAWMVEDYGTQLAHDGNHKRHRTARKSFFRRLHEQKYPDTAIDFEQVIFMQKA